MAGPFKEDLDNVTRIVPVQGGEKQAFILENYSQIVEKQ